MAVYDFDSSYALIVNTDSYTGNFERDFCAYVTGAYGECGVGREMSKIFFEEEGNGDDNYLCDITVNEMDDRGCARPVSIYNDNDTHNSLIIFFEEEPMPDQWDLMLRRAKKFCETRPDWPDYLVDKPIIPIEFKGMRLISNEVVRTQKVLLQA